MKKNVRLLSAVMAVMMLLASVFAFASCGKKTADYTIGICNFVDDASLNQIVENIRASIKEAEEKQNIKIEVLYDNCNADSAVLAQIISNFTAKKVDLMVAVATPVAIAMQAATEDSKIPVVFAAVSDPLGAKLVESAEKPGANITGTSDFLDTDAIMNLIFANNADTAKVGLLYDIGQDSSTGAIEAAKAFLAKKGVEAVVKTGTNVDEIVLAAKALVNEKVDAVFTPSDNTVMTAELSIYETLANAGIPHFAGADSFALNGAFCGYGVDYAQLGRETGNMVVDILVNKKNPGDVPVKFFDNGTATVNTEICEKLGYDPEKVEQSFAPFCSKFQTIKTAEKFE
ncbi:MAG: ABC transporter substrate-binding protein [Clostridia bacterium]|nr:ABC transporter substrate-binding protein [Clostridia bacterium]